MSKFTLPEGCCICGTKNSTSQFRPWHDHHTEDLLCRVFGLKTLDGRRGYICNPCVLFIKRTKDAMKNNTLNLDPRQRLDFKLKGRRTPMDIHQQDTNSKQQQEKIHGFAARNMRVYPKYVYLGKSYLRLKSKHQAIPAGPWRNPRDFLEEESDAESDLGSYRRTTLNKGKKTLVQMKQEKAVAEARENQRLFGEVFEERVNQALTDRSKVFQQENDETSQSGKMHAKKKTNVANIGYLKEESEENEGCDPINHGSSYREDHGSSTIYRADQAFTKNAAAQVNGLAKTYGTRSNVSKGRAPIINFKRNNQHEDHDEETDTCDEMIDEDDSSEDEIKRARDRAVTRNKSKLHTALDGSCSRAKRIKHNSPCASSIFNTPATSSTSISLDHNTSFYVPSSSPSSIAGKKMNRRVIRAPVKNFKRPTVTFMDCSYWQKFHCCCFELYVGENGMCVLSPMRLHQCSRHEAETFAIQHSVIRPATKLVSNLPSDVSEKSTMSVDAPLSSGASTSQAADEDWEVESVMSSELLHPQGVAAANTSSQDVSAFHDTDACITPKETFDLLLEVASLSSGEDEMNDSRIFTNPSPMISDKSCDKFL